MKRIRVLVVDDSALVRSLLAEIINRQADMECIGTANDPIAARELIRALDPDVLTLDVEMPRMDGLDFLGRLMRLRPMPVVMISTLTERGAEVTLRALELGAVDFVSKPKLGLADGINELASQIVEKIRVAAVSRIRRAQPVGRDFADPTSASTGAPTSPVGLSAGSLSTEKLICIGASTGGTEAIREVLMRLPADVPGIVIAQHMPPGFTASFAARLNNLCHLTVLEAVHGARLLPRHAYVAPGGRQFRVGRSGVDLVAVVDDGEPVNRHRPSIDVLFRSVASVVGPNAYGILLTGMGVDGASAMREMKDAGGYNFVQDEATCIVFGMPKEAIALGAANEVLPLVEIAPALLARLRRAGARIRT